MSFRDTNDLSEEVKVNKTEAKARRLIPEKGNFKEIELGAGNKTFKGDERGIWMGSDDFETAPWRVDMNGNTKIIASELTQDISMEWWYDGKQIIFLGVESDGL